MPRKKRDFLEPPRHPPRDLVDRLAHELKNGRESGQPMIEEEEFPTGKLRVTVIWDAWDRVPLEDRTAVILRAYETAEGRPYRDRIALASGLTVLEATAAGMLPFQIIPAVRKGDPVTLEQCHKAMEEEGASTFFGADPPLLRFATEEDAGAARKRLAARLPNSEPVWVITRDVTIPEFDRGEDLAQAVER
jgi:hypothetical protein